MILALFLSLKNDIIIDMERTDIKLQSNKTIFGENTILGNNALNSTCQHQVKMSPLLQGENVTPR